MSQPTVRQGQGCPLRYRDAAFARRLDRQGSSDFVDAVEAEAYPRHWADLLASMERLHGGSLRGYPCLQRWPGRSKAWT